MSRPATYAIGATAFVAGFTLAMGVAVGLVRVVETMIGETR